jgi:3-hydroxyacyl-[acyl-carrier-protein] dehydratase
MLDKDQVQGIIPHRPPFLWIDRVEELKAGEHCIAAKYIDPSEPIFAGHFPGNAIFPGVLIIESAAQTAAVMLGSLQIGDRSAIAKPNRNQTHLLASVNRFKFLKPVRPGAMLRIETRKIAELGTMAWVEAKIWVEDQQVAKGELTVLTADQDYQEIGA